jgi:hypothetical protein
VGQPKYAFFPGCQLGASDPRYVSLTYARLLELDSSVAMMLACCGAPVFWAGDEPGAAAHSRWLKEQWQQLGEPILITVCPTCVQMLRTALPDAQTISLYSLPLAINRSAGFSAPVSVFDPCAGRHDMVSQDAIRQMLVDAGFRLEPLPKERDEATCCGWGGQYSIANPKLSRQVSLDAATMLPNTYITWCVNCRDTFAAHGKPAWHILDLILGLSDNPALREPPTISERRRNREKLQALVLERFFGKQHTGSAASAAASNCQSATQNQALLLIDAPLARKLSDEWILEEDVWQTLLECEQSQVKFYDASRDCYIGHKRLKATTLWIEYHREGANFRLSSAYQHRMNIVMH